MVIKIIGIEKQDYKLDNGYAFQGLKIHAADLETVKNSLVGNLTTTIKIPAESPFYNEGYAVGECYRCYFTQKGALDYISRVDPADLIEDLTD